MKWISVALLLTACEVEFNQEPSKSAFYIITCRVDHYEDCTEELNKYCSNPLSTTRTENKDKNTVTVTKECKQ